MTRLRRILISVLLSYALISPAMAEIDAAETAAGAAELLEQAGFALLEADSARDRVEALTQTVRAYEEGLQALRAGIRQAALQERTILLVFEAERERLAQLLGVLQSIEGSAAPMMILHPDGPLDAARSGMIVSEVTPAVAREASALRQQLEELTTLRALQDDALTLLSQALDQAQTARSGLSQAIADRGDLPERFVEDAEAMDRLVQSVESLDILADVLTAASADQAAAPSGFDTAAGTLSLPVLGAVLRRFNETDAAGITRPGLVYASAPSALVTNPWPATVRYAGRLLDYGNVIILEPDARYLLVLGGLGDLYVAPGQLVPSGAPLGLMPGDNTDQAELIIPGTQDTGAGLTETLYIELREDGVPVDPGPWFAAGAGERPE